jgi:hypothetical protein
MPSSHSAPAEEGRRRDRNPQRRASSEEGRDAELSARRDVEEIELVLGKRRLQVRRALAEYLRGNREVLRSKNITRDQVQGWVRAVETHVERWIRDIQARWPGLGDEDFEEATVHIRDCLRALLRSKSVLRRLRLQSARESCSSLSTRELQTAAKKLSSLPRAGALLKALYGLENLHLKTFVVAAAAASAVLGSAGLGVFLAKHPEWWPAGHPLQDGEHRGPPTPASGAAETDARASSFAEIAAQEAAEREANAAAHRQLSEESGRRTADNARAIAKAQYARDTQLRHEENLRHEQKGRDEMAGSTTLWNNWTYWAPFIYAAFTGAPYLSALLLSLGVGGTAVASLAAKTAAAASTESQARPRLSGSNQDLVARTAALIERARSSGSYHL